MSPKVDTFPNEILIHIFNELDIYDIFHCLLTCRVFHETIRDSLILQYRVELAAAGVEDTHTDSRRSIPERLAQLKTIEQGWANLHFRQKHTLDWPQWHPWELYGDVLASGIHISTTPTTHGLAFMRLPSAADGSPVHTWEHVNMGVKIQDFAMDPAQDLVALIAKSVTVRVGGNHPNASDPILFCIPRHTRPTCNFIIRIMGDFLAFLLRIGPLDAELFIWNWKTGRPLTYLEASSPGIDNITSFSFLSPRHFVTGRCTLEQQPELDVYDFLAVNPKGSLQPLLVRRYQLPHMTQDTHLLYLLTQSDPSPETSLVLSTTPGSSFRSVPSSHLLAVTMDYRFREEPAQRCVLFVHHSSLLEDLEPTSMLNDMLVPWEKWGPRKTRMMRVLFSEDAWVYDVHGTRCVRPDSFALIGGTSICRLRMLDFNQLALRRGGLQMTTVRTMY
ncbi:hypothetical protein JB92DRAFT_3107823 [Gautieria morchelliformis]|nr:hypothetical protein JB92DRAFT_3107823 [Gautieria morchelliformis]